MADAVYIEPLTVPVIERINRARAARRAAAHAGRADGPQPRRRAGERGRAREVRREAAGHAPGVDPAGGGPASSSTTCWPRIGEPVLDSEPCETLEACEAAAERIGLPVGHPARLHAGGARAEASPSPPGNCGPSPPAGWPPAPSRRCSSSATWGGWKEGRVRGHARRRGQLRDQSATWRTMDPMGVHTGDSIVVAPSQTLNGQGLPDAALGGRCASSTSWALRAAATSSSRWPRARTCATGRATRRGRCPTT